MKNTISHLRKPFVAALHDITMAALSFSLSLYLRLGDNVDYSASFFMPSLILFTSACAAVFLGMGLYRGLWRYASTQDLMALAKAVTLAILIFIPLMFLFNRLEGLPRSVLAINWFVLLTMLGAPRFIYRMIKDKTLLIDLQSIPDSQKISVILVGVNDFTEAFLRHAVERKNSEYRVVGLLDIDGSQVGRHLHNVKIHGNVKDFAKVYKKLKNKQKTPQKIIISPDSIKGDLLQNLMRDAESFGMTVARLPRITELHSNTENNIPLKPVAIEDLLGRPQATLDIESMKKLVKGRVVLVTGAGGTIGSELCRQIANKSPKKLILLDNAEHNLYTIDHELSNSHKELEKHPIIGDVRSPDNLKHVFNEFSPQIIFHAAALKHVPLSEINICEAAETNTLGTKNVADACISSHAELMILISTDKAVAPSSVMGASKRGAELYLQALNQSSKTKGMKFATVRFGNVLGSSGSVVPLFQKQLENGGPITITHPDMKRYFMTVREAVELVMQAAALRYSAEKTDSCLYVLEMGSPVYIKDLAKQMIRLAGLRPEVDIDIEYTELRPGEKLEEALFLPEESPSETECNSVLLVAPKKENLSQINKLLKKLLSACKNKDRRKSIECLESLIEEFKR